MYEKKKKKKNIHIYIYMCIYIYMYIYTRMYTHLHINIYIYVSAKGGSCDLPFCCLVFDTRLNRFECKMDLTNESPTCLLGS